MAALLQPSALLLTVFLGTTSSKLADEGNEKEEGHKEVETALQENKLTSDGFFMLQTYKVIMIAMQNQIIGDQKKLIAEYEEHTAKNTNLTVEYKNHLAEQKANIEKRVENSKRIMEREARLSGAISLRQAIESFEIKMPSYFKTLNQTERWRELVTNTSSASVPAIELRNITEKMREMNLTPEEFAEKVVSLYEKLSDIIHEHMKNMADGFSKPLKQPHIPKYLIAVAKIIFEHSSWRDSCKPLLEGLAMSSDVNPVVQVSAK